MSRNILLSLSLRRDVFGRPCRVEVGAGVEAGEERLPRRVRHGLRLQEVKPGRQGVHHALLTRLLASNAFLDWTSMYYV